MQVDFSLCLQRHPAPAGGYVAQLTLNLPKQLNALTPEMVEMLYLHLCQLRDDPDAVAVFLDGAGHRAFCSGADARRMLASAMANPGGAAVEAEAFLAREYACFHLIHTFPKPVVVWGHGLVMGAGVGLMAGASHRIVTESSRLSMPEITIGFLPNAGASWYLAQMPGKTGLFAALTATPLDAADALYAGLADYCLADDSRGAVLRSLIGLPWSDCPQENGERLTDHLTDLEAEHGIRLDTAQLKTHRAWIDDSSQSLDADVVARQLQRSAQRSAWASAALESMARGAASSAKLIVAQLQDVEERGLKEVFRLELVLAANRLRDPEFAEGVRARLIDKHRAPNWCYRSIADVPDQEIQALFVAPWEQHPLDEIF